jgi:uncharacterized membrane protein HdeD (DUF308 family)
MSAATPRSPIEDLFAPFARSWWLWVLFGVISIVAGVIALINPDLSLLTVAILFGSWLIVAGFFDLLAGVRAHEADTSRRVFSIVLAVLSLIAGIVCLLRPGAGILALVIVLGVFLVVSGVIELAAAVSDDTPWLSFALALVDVALGIVILAIPDIGLITLALLFGISLVVRGAVAIATGIRLRRLRAPAQAGHGRLATG